MSDNNEGKAREFYVETNFQQMARRPGGVTREQALQRADGNIESLKPQFTPWLDEQLNGFFALIPAQGSVEFDQLGWIDSASIYSQRLADVAATMDYQFVSFVANNLCMIFEAIKRGAGNQSEIIACHVNALRLAQQQKYRRMQPRDLPELTEGLRYILNSPGLQPHLDNSSD